MKLFVISDEQGRPSTSSLLPLTFVLVGEMEAECQTTNNGTREVENEGAPRQAKAVVKATIVSHAIH